MSQVVVTELVVDARGAEAGSAIYTRAMNAAQAAIDKLLDREEKMLVAQEKATAAITGGATSVGRAAAQWQKLAAAADPVIASTQRIAAVQLQVDAAVRRGITTQAEASRVLEIYRQRHDQAAIAARAAGQETDNLLRSLNPAIAAQDRYNQSLEQANRLARENLINEQTRRSAIMAAQRALESAGTPRGPTTALQSNLDYISTVRQSGGSARDSASVFEEAEKAAAALRRELNPLGAAYDQLNDRVDRFRSLRAAQLINDDELTAATARARAEFDKTAESLVLIGDRTKLADHQFSNLRSQAIDIGTMFAMGASPFMIISSQAGQIYEALAGGKGVNASLRALGEMAMSAGRAVVTALGPVGLSIIGVTSLAAGLWYMLSDSPQAKSAEQTIADYDRLVKQLKGTFAGTAAAAEDFFERATRGSLMAMQTEAARSVENTRRLLKEAIADLNVDENGVFPMINPQRARGLDPIRAQIRELYVDLANSEITANEFKESLGELRMDEATPKRMKDFADYILDALPSVIDLEARLGSAELVADDLGDAGARAARLMRENFKAASDELAGMAGDMRSEIEKINDAYDRMMGRATSAADAMAAGQMRDRALAPFRKDAQDALDGERFERRAAGLTDEAAAIEAVTRRYQELIDLHAGDAVTVERYTKAREEATDAVVEQFERERQARDANYELDVRAVTARTAAQKADIEADRVRIDLLAKGHTEAEAAAEADKVRSLSLARSSEQLTESLRQQTEATTRQIEQAQLEYDLVGKSAGEVARLRAEFEMLAQAKDAATAAGYDASTVTLTESMRTQAAEIGRLTEATQRLNFERDLLFDRQQATRSPEEQDIAAQLRSMGVDYESAQGKADAAQLRLNNRLHETNDLIWEMRDAGKDAFADLVMAIGSGEGALAAFANAFSGLGQKMMSAGLDKIADTLFGTAKGQTPSGGIVGALGNLAGAVGQPRAPSYMGPVGQTFGAPVIPVERSALGPIEVSLPATSSRSVERAGNAFLSLIRKAEGTAGQNGYNTSLAYGAFTGGERNLTSMTLSQIDALQTRMLQHPGNSYNSSALGAYQIVRTTLRGLREELKLSADQLYTPELQDRLAIQLANRRGASVSGLRNEWEGLRRVEGGTILNAYGSANDNAPPSTTSIRALRQAVSDGSVDATRRLATGAVPGVGSGYAAGSDPWTSGGIDLRTVSPGGAGGGSPLGGIGGFLGKQIAQPGTFLGMQHNGLTIGGGLGTAAGGFSAGYSSGSPVSGALGGALAGVGGGPVGMAIGAISGAIGGIFGGRAQREQEHRDKAAKWAEMRPAYEEFDRSLSDEGTGQLREWITTAADKLNGFMKVAGEAWKYGEGGTSADFQATGTKMFARFGEMMQEFRDQFLPTIDDLMRGDGMNGAFAQARAAVKNLDKQIDGFLDDVSIAFGSEDLGIATSAEFRAAADETRAFREEQIALAKRAAGEYALSLLYTANVTSDVQKTLDGFAGTAKGLTKILLDLGWEADAAAAAIDERLKLAIGEISKAFVEGFESQIRDLEGRGYENDVMTLLRDRDTALSDAALLGVDPTIVTRWFTLAAQSIVDGAELSGEAFQDLLTLFPQLTGVVTSFTAATEEAITAEEARALAQDNAVSKYSAAVQARSEAENDLRAAYQRSKGEIETLISRLEGFKESVGDFLTNLKLDPRLSVLDNGERLTEAEKLFRETAAKAMTGDEDAQGRLLDLAQKYLDESLSYNASSSAYLATFNEVQAILKQAEASAGTQITAAQKQLAALERQVDKLIDIDDAVLTVADAVRAMERSIGDVLKLQLELDHNRNFGADTARNQEIVAGLRNVGLAYTGNFGNGQFDQWVSGLAPKDRILAESVVNGTVSRLGDYPQRNAMIVRDLRAAGLDYTGSFGNGAFGRWVASLPQTQQNTANAIANQYATIMRQAGGLIPSLSGGGVVSNGVYDRDSVFASIAGGGRAMLAGGEAIITARGVNAETAPMLDHINRNFKLPTLSMPAMPQIIARNDNRGLEMRIEQLTREVVFLREDNNRVTRAGSENIRAGTDETTAELRAHKRSDKLAAAKAA